MSHASLQVKNYYTRLLRFIVARDIFVALTAALLIICVGIFLGYANNKVVPLNPDATARYIAEPHNPLSFLSNWDGPDYLRIAAHGYQFSVQTNLFPVYPVLIRAVNFIMSSPLDSALLISWASLVGVIWVYIKLIKILFPVQSNMESLRAVLFFLIFPTGVFLLATYTESLFALLTLGSLYFVLRGRYLLSAFLVMLACTTHITGVFMLALIILIMFERKMKIYKIVFAAAIGSLGIIGYMSYLFYRFGQPLAFLNAQKQHGWLDAAARTPFSNIGWLNILMVGLILWSAYYWWHRRAVFSLYSLAFLLIPIVGGQFGGFNRYVLMAFPIQFMLYDKTRRSTVAYTVVICMSTLLWTYTTLQYAGGYVGG